jgi:hypothetical protein
VNITTHSTLEAVHCRRGCRGEGVAMPESADGRDGLNWRKAMRSMNHGACAEVASGVSGTRGIVIMRDSMDPEGPVLLYSGSAWRSFVKAAKESNSKILMAF